MSRHMLVDKMSTVSRQKISQYVPQLALHFDMRRDFRSK